MIGSGPLYERRWQALTVLCLSLLIVNLDNLVLNVALPTLARKLSADGSQLQWMVDAYVLVFAGLLLTAGTIGDRFGRKKVLYAGYGVFSLGSVSAALSSSADFLIAMRVVMGIGGALIMPSTLSILTNIFPPRSGLGRLRSGRRPWRWAYRPAPSWEACCWTTSRGVRSF